MKKLLIIISLLLCSLLLLSGCSFVVETLADTISASWEKDNDTLEPATQDNLDAANIDTYDTDIEAYVAENPYTNLEFHLGNEVALASTVNTKAIAAKYDDTSTVTVSAVNLAGEINALSAAAPAISTVLAPAAPGTVTYGNAKATIDASNSADGYIMISYSGGASSKIKVLIDCPSGIRYTYDLNAYGTYETFPLSDGNGNYTIGIYENISANQYATAYTTSMSITLNNQFAPFLRPNQYVNFAAGSTTVNKAAELCIGLTSELDKVSAVYNYVVSTLTYDRELAATVQSGYLPNVDNILARQKGICFDYAALMTAMLRSQGVPTKLVVGYSGSVYHAWISTYVATQGWVNGVIYFDGIQWKLMDPTFASTGNSSAEILQYIGNGNNYSAKFIY